MSLKVYRITDVKNGAYLFIDARSKEAAAHAVGKTLADIHGGRIRIEKVGPGPKWKHPPKNEVGYAPHD